VATTRDDAAMPGLARFLRRRRGEMFPFELVKKAPYRYTDRFLHLRR
jgi:hypothetical protein